MSSLPASETTRAAIDPLTRDALPHGAADRAATAHGADPAAMTAIFTFLLAAGILLHQAILGDWRVLSHHALVSLAALWAVLHPRSLRALFLLIVAQTVSCLIDMPYVVNHWLMLACTNLTILTCAAGLALRRREWPVDAAALYRCFAPALRVQVVLMYLLAMLAKLNRGFFDPELSSAVALYGELVRKLPFLPSGDWTRLPAIYGTVAIELALPLLLLWQRTRLVAVFAGIGFHFTMAVAGFIPFSGIAMAFLFLFLPDDLPARLRAIRDRYPALTRAAQCCAALLPSVWIFAALAAVWLAAAAIRTEEWLPVATVRRATIRTAQGLYILHIAACTVLLWRCVRRRAPVAWPAGAFRLAHPALAAFPLLLLLNGLCPYVGLKTECSFTMYSNLQTEADQWNHLLLPRAMRLFHWQDDLVTILDSDDPLLAQAAREGNRWAFFQFQRYLSEHPDVAVEYRYRDQQRRLPRAAADPDLSRPPHLLARKLFWFRDIPPPDRNTIRH